MTAPDVRTWIRSELQLPPALELTLLTTIDALLAREHEAASEDARAEVEAVVAHLTARLDRLAERVAAHESSIAALTRHFQGIVAELTDRANRDPKTQLVSFPHFLDQLAVHLCSTGPGGWCAVGFADITSFKWYNDALGHTVGDQIIETVARLLREQVRVKDLVAFQQPDGARLDLHARFGGDEFCFLIPQIDALDTATAIANRFRQAVGAHGWSSLHLALASRPVAVDVGVACLRLGPPEEREHLGPQLAQELLMYADKLMYQAKADGASRPYPVALEIGDGALRVVGETTT
jgi:diguanylate cyclase (GGDEF)-like protein